MCEIGNIHVLFTKHYVISIKAVMEIEKMTKASENTVWRMTRIFK